MTDHERIDKVVGHYVDGLLTPTELTQEIVSIRMDTIIGQNPRCGCIQCLTTDEEGNVL